MGFMAGSRRPKFEAEAAQTDPITLEISAADQETLTMVRAALSQRRMRLAFQPAVYAADPTIIGFYEGYIRLLDPQDRVIPARDFMDVAETQELGREIDVAALQLGLATLQKNRGIRVSVNMSARSVGYRKWVQVLRQALKTHPGLGRGLILEISEASAMQMPDVLIPFMKELRSEQIAFTLDDFGAGATSLQLLSDFGFDIAKLDGRFIRGIERDAENQRILRAAIAMAREFGMFLVAEAVETAEEADWLAAQGVGCLQGYLFGKPEVNPDFRLFRHGRG